MRSRFGEMSNLGFFKSIVYHGDVCLGEVEVSHVKNQEFQFPNNEIRINYISQQSERCLPLSILETLSPFTVPCKIRANFTSEQSLLYRLYITCLHELKTAVVLLGNEELHLVALPSRQEKFPCFWCCSVPIGLYGSCSMLLNRRCLAIVFDLDETLIVANTMKSFEDRIEVLQKRISIENDPVRISGMTAELRRYLEDHSLLKQYAETDSVLDNGQLLKVHPEEVPLLSGEHERMFRPIIRLKDKNIVLTRINPEIRDTSVLVRLRPAWEDLRSYLTAKGRKRFEVYVCTMAERDYALEIWRLLDPELHLISSDKLLGRVVCVKSGSRKSLLTVFHDRMCNPKMALVIDDRLKVWEDMDQPRVHVVPPFTPYYAPQADTANAVPVLCVARNVACNVRAGFFKEFDENLLRRISEICYEDEIANLPYAPDVSDYMMSEDPSFVPNGNREIPFPEGMNGPEVERRLNRLDERNIVDFPNPDMRPETSHPPITVLPILVPGTSRTSLPVLKASLPEASGGIEVNSSETNPDTWRRLHEQSSAGPFLPKTPSQGPASSLQGRGGWLVEDISNNEQHNNGDAELSRQSNSAQDKLQVQQNLPNCLESSMLSVMPHAYEAKTEEALGHERKKHNHVDSSLPLTSGNATGHQVSASSKALPTEARKSSLVPPFISIGVLQEIGRRCGSKIEFRSVVSTSKDLQFSVEVLFTGQKIAAGMGKTKKDAQQQAAQNALRCLADEYASYITPRPGLADRDLNKLPSANENGFLWDDVDPGTEELPLKEALPDASISEAAEETTGGSASLGTQQRQKRPNSPRLSHSLSAKRLKVELPGLQVSSSQYQKTGDPVS